MADRSEIDAQVGLAALLDTECLRLALLDREIVEDVALWGPAGEGAAEVVASHPSMRWMVEAAVTSDRPQVRAVVAARQDIDAALYAMFASDPHPVVRAKVAANVAAPRAVVERLCDDPEPTVHDAAQRELGRRMPRQARRHQVAVAG